MAKTISLAGVFPPIPTPFTLEGELDLAHLATNVTAWGRTNLAGLVVLGSNGEYVALSEAEKLAVLARVRESLSTDKLLIAGTGCDGTAPTIALTRRAAELGADAAIVVTPHYFKSRLDSRAFVAHYTAIAEASPIPILLYNVPANTGLDIPVDAVLKLAEHPNIIGMKESGGMVARIGEIVRGAPDRFQVLAGSVSFCYPAMAMGAVGVISALANVAPEACVRLHRLVLQGDHLASRALQLKLLPANAAVTTRFGVPGLKAALDLVGDYYGGPPRLPLLPLDEAGRAAVRAALVDGGIL